MPKMIPYRGGGVKTYLSFGGGVKSVAMHLLLLDVGWEFEAVFVDHGCDWPETYEYLELFQGWLKEQGHEPITVIGPEYYRKRDDKTWNNLYDYAYNIRIIPMRSYRWCTRDFKVNPLIRYHQKPCQVCLGFAIDEAHRASLACRDGETLRYPLIEHEMTRQDCIDYIKSHGLPVPDKSGCWFCPFQRLSEFRKLRQVHPDLYCKAKTLEDRSVKRREKEGKEPYYLKDKPLDIIVSEDQGELFEEYKPPCYCAR